MAGVRIASLDLFRARCRSTRSASAGRCPHGDDGWSEFATAADSAALGGKEAGKIEPLHPSYPIMRRPRVDLEEKHEPRAATSAGRRAILGKEQAWHSESALTSAAIEKLPFAGIVPANGGFGDKGWRC